MKKFEDLQFREHSIYKGLQATMTFNNGYGVSVVKFIGTYGFPNLWEVAIIYKGSIAYNTHIADSVLGHLTEQDVTSVMKQVQNLI